MRTCKTCGESQPLEEYHVHAPSKGGRVLHCRSCVAEKARKKNYGLSLAEVREAQGTDACAICGEESYCIDHDHTTGIVRGALCRKCNTGLHYLENERWRYYAERYLLRTESEEAHRAYLVERAQARGTT
jgi:hypothetical protein